MKLILIHGSFEDAILKKIAEIKKSFDPLATTEISEYDPGFHFSSPSLFSDKRLVILENPDIKIIEQGIVQSDPDLTILIRCSKGLEKSSAVLKKVIEARGEVFSFEESSQVSIFPFLDMLGNLNKRAYGEFEKNYNEFGGQYILTMLAYFLRRMVVKTKSSSDFMRQKIETQRKNFGLEKIRKLYREVITTDYKIKQGLAEDKLALTLLIQKILN